uniref:Transposon protein, putative, unclassified n=1 Tax=Oryza sativa subsp. japonica TaxID=39947 RepID=Q2QU97_ORYSJ|nr:transposon protein, putative, unclassified [Oryza sativa Japonica Group]
MSWHRAGVLLLGAQSCLPVPGVPAVGGIGSVLLSMARMGWKLCHVFRLYTVVMSLHTIVKTKPQTKPYPLDMWKYGSALQQRPELNPYSTREITAFRTFGDDRKPRFGNLRNDEDYAKHTSKATSL